MQDPTWGLKGSTMSRRYLETVLDYIAANPTGTVIAPAEDPKQPDVQLGGGPLPAPG